MHTSASNYPHKIFIIGSEINYIIYIILVLLSMMYKFDLNILI